MSGLLGSVYSFGDRLKKRVRGLLDDPVNQIKTNIETWAADANEAMQTPEGIASMMLGSGLLGRIVYHGSPHKFDRFDSSKIGTGEGAQAYGHGLYLAESPEVARSYQKKLSDDGSALAARWDQLDSLTAKAAKDPKWQNMRDSVAAELVGKERPGALYKVDLPDEAIAKMLDWDKPLNKQLEIMAALQSVGLQDLQPGYLGKGAYESLASQLMGRGTSRYAQDQASEVLRKAGIPGIRYLDGGSRGAGQGTSNFVVFPGNEGLLTILERNGMPLR